MPTHHAAAEPGNGAKQQAEPARIGRAHYVYDMPASLAKETGIHEIGVVALTAEEELMAIRRADGMAHRLAFELAKQALVSVNGKPVSVGDASVDRAWEQMGALGRRLLTDATSSLTVPAEEDLAAFRSSRRVIAG